MFGVVKNKIMYGKKVKGIERSTFLIGADGLLKQEWRGLKVPGHVDEVLKAVKASRKPPEKSSLKTGVAEWPLDALASRIMACHAAELQQRIRHSKKPRLVHNEFRPADCFLTPGVIKPLPHEKAARPAMAAFSLFPALTSPGI